MHFFYDEQGRPFGLWYSKDGGSSYAQYYYALNAQGDVEGIFSTKLNEETGLHDIYWMGHYEYDAWGNFKVIAPNGTTPTNPAHLMNRNPLRYRGYYYDTETGFYYLQSRYYDPANHRFINADSLVSTGQGFTGTNMFAYCLNNPVRKKDISGDACQEIIDNGNPTDDDKEVHGGHMSNGGFGGLKIGKTVPKGGTNMGEGSYNNGDNVGTSQAPKNGLPGSTYTQVSGGQSPHVISVTTYGEYTARSTRIDYYGRDHGVGLPHIHYFSWRFHNGMIQPTGEVVRALAP